MKLFSMSGRANRAPYFWHTLLDGLVVFFLIMVLWGSAFGLTLMGVDAGGAVTGLAVLIAFAIFFAAFVAELCITVRRLHDLDRTGWQWLLSFVPFVNLYIWFMLVFQPGTSGSNRYGENPLA